MRQRNIIRFASDGTIFKLVPDEPRAKKLKNFRNRKLHTAWFNIAENCWDREGNRRVRYEGREICRKYMIGKGE
jgi:hypothetical protein